MRHIELMSRKSLHRANWFDDLCFIAFLLNKLISFMGGQSPFFLFVEDKCHITTDNNSSGNT